MSKSKSQEIRRRGPTVSHTSTPPTTFPLIEKGVEGGDLPKQAILEFSHALQNFAAHTDDYTYQKLLKVMHWAPLFRGANSPVSLSRTISDVVGSNTIQVLGEETLKELLLHYPPLYGASRQFEDADELVDAIFELMGVDESLHQLLSTTHTHKNLLPLWDHALTLYCGITLPDKNLHLLFGDHTDELLRHRLTYTHPGISRAPTSARATLPPLAILGGLEGSALLGRPTLKRLPEQRRTYELETVRHLEASGIMRSIRVALAFPNAGEFIRTTELLEVGEGERALAGLYSDYYGRCYAYIRGERSYDSLHAWKDGVGGVVERFNDPDELTRRARRSNIQLGWHICNICHLGSVTLTHKLPPETLTELAEVVYRLTT